MDLHAVLIFAGTALAAPVLTWLAHLFITAAKNRRAIMILRAEPLVFEGARFTRMLSKAGVLLMDRGRVTAMTRKRIECRDDDGAVMTFTPRELVDAWPLWDGGDAGSDLPPRPHYRRGKR